MSTAFLAVVAVAAVLGAATSAVAGAGISSVLVPLLALRMDPKLAVALTTVPHLIGGGMRVVQLRRAIDRKVLLHFGGICAIASIGGAILHRRAPSNVILDVFAALLIVAGIVAVLGVAEHLRLGKRWAWSAGLVTGFCGGFAGEQGGLRAVGMLGFDLEKDRFVATSTAVGILIDVCRLPVYAISEGKAFHDVTALVVIGVATVIGTLVGARVHEHIPERWFKRIIGAALVVLGLLLVLH